MSIRDEPGVTAEDAGLSSPIRHEPAAIIGRLLRPGMGILAAGESVGTIGRRFDRAGVALTEGARRAHRELLCTGPGPRNVARR